MKLLISHEDWIKEEIERCRNDRHYFYINYWLVDGKVPNISKEEFESITENSKVAIVNMRLKPRRPIQREQALKMYNETPDYFDLPYNRNNIR